MTRWNGCLFAVLCQLGICQVLSFWNHAGYFAKRRVRLVAKASRSPAATWSLGAPSCLCWIVQSSQFFSLYRIQEYQGDQSIIKPSICSSFGLEYRLRDYNHLVWVDTGFSFGRQNPRSKTLQCNYISHGGESKQYLSCLSSDMSRYSTATLLIFPFGGRVRCRNARSKRSTFSSIIRYTQEEQRLVSSYSSHNGYYPLQNKRGLAV